MAKQKNQGKKKKLSLEDYREQFVTVYPTAENPYHTQNVSFAIHPKQAALLEKKGFVTQEMPEGWVEKEEDEDIIETGSEELMA